MTRSAPKQSTWLWLVSWTFAFVVATGITPLTPRALGEDFPEITTGMVGIQPDETVMNSWKNDLHGGVAEAWPIENPEVFFDQLSRAGAPEQDIKLLRKQLQAAPDKFTVRQIQDFVSYDPSRHQLLLIDRAHHESLHKKTLQEAYLILSESHAKFYDTIPRSWVGESHSQDRFWQGSTDLLVTPSNWSTLPESTKEKLIRLRTGSPMTIHFFIRYDQASIEDVLVRFTTPWDRAAARSLMKDRLKEREVATVRLDEISVSYVRQRHATFQEFSGQDCARCAKSTAAGFLGLDNTNDVMAHTQAAPEGTAVEANQMLIYGNEEGTPQHLAFSVTRAIVFTKNGHSKFVPYRFQWLREHDQIWAEQGATQRQALHLVSPLPDELRGSPFPCRNL